MGSTRPSPARADRHGNDPATRWPVPPPSANLSSVLPPAGPLSSIRRRELIISPAALRASHNPVTNTPARDDRPVIPTAAIAAAGAEAEGPAGFDPALARYPTRRVPAHRVIDLLRITHRPDCVSAYRDRMRRGEAFPPISVIRVGRLYLVADGHKRLQAWLGLAPGVETLLVEHWPWRRWARDQWEQFRRKQADFAAALRGGPGSRKALIGLILSTLRHWWRVARSLAGFALVRNPVGQRDEHLR